MSEHESKRERLNGAHTLLDGIQLKDVPRAERSAMVRQCEELFLIYQKIFNFLGAQSRSNHAVIVCGCSRHRNGFRSRSRGGLPSFLRISTRAESFAAIFSSRKFMKHETNQCGTVNPHAEKYPKSWEYFPARFPYMTG
jgi:hypothetical protein